MFSLPEEKLPPLEIMYEPNPFKIEGRRIVDIGHLLKEINKKIINHSIKCARGRMYAVNEKRKGLNSEIIFFCNTCKKYEIISMDNGDINLDFTWGLSSVGAGYAQGEELLAVLNVPMMAKSTFLLRQKKTKCIWESKLLEEMKENAQIEKEIAIESGDVDSDGIPFITVVVDGGWSKRSYGHNYNALSGVGCIIGYSGSSTAMESNIIVEGFKKSIPEYNIKYKYVIGDGDSSVYARLIENVSYGREIINYECANHSTKCLTTNLYRLTKNKLFSATERQILTKKIKSISRNVRHILTKPHDATSMKEALDILINKTFTAKELHVIKK